MAQMAVTFRGHFGTDLEVVNAAKVSFGKESSWSYALGERILKPADSRLIKFLARAVTTEDFAALLKELARTQKEQVIADAIKDFRACPQHRSPFNHCFASFHVKAPILVARQLVKHEYLPWNEVSGRYVTFLPEFYDFPEMRRKVADKKQGSGAPITGDAGDELQAVFSRNQKDSFARYQRALELGLCEEQARALLPLNLMTEWRWSGTLGAFAKMAAHRVRDDAQKETQVVAKAISDKMGELFPVSWGALVHGDY